MRSLFFAVLLSTMALSACAQVKADPAADRKSVV